MISYEPFFRLMRERGITSYRLAKMGFPMSNYHAMRRGKNISTQTLDSLCELLDCRIEEIIEHKKTDAEN